MSKPTPATKISYFKIDKEAVPNVGAMLGHVQTSYVNEIAAWGYGATFVTALENNLRLTQTLFHNDANFQSDFRSNKRSTVLPRLAELWLAAHFVRSEVDLSRVPQSTRRTPDFTFRVDGHSLTFLLEVGRIEDYPNRPSISTVGSIPIEAIAGTPSQLSQTDFGRRLRNLMRHKAAQFRSPSPYTQNQSYGILAWDIGESHDFQILPQTDQSAAQWLRSQFETQAQKSHVDALFCFAMSLANEELHMAQLFPLTEQGTTTIHLLHR